MRIINKVQSLYFARIIPSALAKICLAIIPVFSPGSLTVLWNPNSESDLAGYKVYYGTAPRDYGTVVDVGNVTSYQVDGLTEGVRYYFAVTAYDLAGNESDYSKEASAVVGENDPTEPTGTETTLENVYNFPNPFKLNLQRTQIRYYLENSSSVTIKIYDLNNQLVKIILNNLLKSEGEHTEDFWEGKNAAGDFVASGVYFCKIDADGKNNILRIAVDR